ncbi:putative DNA binding domain-containing protein [Flavobacterium sp. MFBS3-15]|uniref:RNA-binding domain-containing protein n=1 Tax=Flavobacterium sp. MFBS3-15 TaxID=2989816 RepID=UPI002235675C|nr:RNA-binding domain-containing protein [Flavobacterium sp. MFBS3-15]MCW4467671.1 putative DNA binding domain-containing protein [Flavobacterium sp. MFBS3-15]
MREEELIRDLINSGEGEQLEFKQSVHQESIGMTLCSFLNTNGGRIIIGVNDEGAIKDIPDIDAVVERLKRYLVASIVPEVPITISKDYFEGHSLIMVKVYKGSNPPYIFDGSIYYRRKDLSVKATSQEISELIHGRRQSDVHWERKPSLPVEFEDLDEKLIKKTIEESRINHRSNFNSESIIDFLSHFGLYQNGYFTNACVVLFAKYPAKFLPQVRVRLTEYGDSKIGDSLIRDEVFEGNLFDTRDKLENYINNLGIRSAFSNNQWKRIDFKFPTKALQEGIINALMHRDYSNVSSGVAISVYPDKLIISNSGHLPNNIKVSELRKSHISHPVNPDIAHIVFLRGLIDKLGRGTLKVIDECQKEGLKDPIWKDGRDGITLTFNGPKLVTKRPIIKNIHFKDSLRDLNDGNNDGNKVIDSKVYKIVETIINDAVDDGAISQVGPVIIEELSNIIQLLIAQGEVTTTDITNYIDKSKPTVERYISLAKKVGLLNYRGTRRQGIYYLTDNVKSKLDQL